MVTGKKNKCDVAKNWRSAIAAPCTSVKTADSGVNTDDKIINDMTTGAGSALRAPTGLVEGAGNSANNTDNSSVYSFSNVTNETSNVMQIDMCITAVDTGTCATETNNRVANNNSNNNINNNNMICTSLDGEAASGPPEPAGAGATATLAATATDGGEREQGGDDGEEQAGVQERPPVSVTVSPGPTPP